MGDPAGSQYGGITSQASTKRVYDPKKTQAVVLCAAVGARKTTACIFGKLPARAARGASSSLACVYSGTQDYCLRFAKGVSFVESSCKQ